MPCISGRCALRARLSELCRTCHDCSTGMACLIGVAHMGNAHDIASLSVNNCLSCHDGTIGKDEGGAGNHKVGVTYHVGEKFRRIRTNDVILINNRVTCLSCHQPYSKAYAKLSRSNNEGALCLSCHRK